MIPNLTKKQRSNLTQKVSLIYFQNLNLIPNQTKVNKLAKQEIKTQINKIKKHPKPSKSKVGHGLGRRTPATVWAAVDSSNFSGIGRGLGR